MNLKKLKSYVFCIKVYLFNVALTKIKLQKCRITILNAKIFWILCLKMFYFNFKICVIPDVIL